MFTDVANVTVHMFADVANVTVHMFTDMAIVTVGLPSLGAGFNQCLMCLFTSLFPDLLLVSLPAL